jgi:5-methylcytosine-specific restriction endonuclease McrA
MICAYCGKVTHRCQCALPDSPLRRFLERRPQPTDYQPLLREQPYKRAVPPQIKQAQRALLRRHAQLWMLSLQNTYGECCANCGSVDKLVIDHIIPIARGGISALENLQLLCAVCNRIKGKLAIDCRHPR